MQIQVADIVAATRAEGPGLRFALWLQGCPLRCPGCCNPEMLPFSGGTPMQVDQIVRAVQLSETQHGIEGVTLLGGEPFAHAEGASLLAQETQFRGLSVMVFSGFTIEELRRQSDPHVERLLSHTDILVDGPYRKELGDTSRRWIGSTNQQIHFLSDRYREYDQCWDQSDTLEIRMTDGEVVINGFPARRAVSIWKRL